MAHYAFLDKNNQVVQVIVGKDEGEGIYDWEVYYGQELRLPCKRTSYNTRGGIHYDSSNNPSIDQTKAFRKNYAGIGYSYDSVRDAFIPPKPFDSWVLDEQSCLWQAPTPQPQDGKLYSWNEATTSWLEVVTAEPTV